MPDTGTMVTDLPETTTLEDEDLLYVVASDTSQKITKGNFKNAVKSDELLDIRTGATGETYSSAGEAVRTQIENINNALNEYKSDEDYYTLLTDKWVVGNLNASGKYAPDIRSRATTYGYIEFKVDTTIYFSQECHFIICKYTANKTLISRTPLTADHYDVTANTILRLTLYLNDDEIYDAFDLGKLVKIKSSLYKTIEKQNEIINSINEFASGSEYLKPMATDWIHGNLYTDGSIRTNVKTRVSTFGYHQFDTDTQLFFTSPKAIIVCYYDENHNLIERLTPGTVHEYIIQANRNFRMTIYTVPEVTINDPLSYGSIVRYKNSELVYTSNVALEMGCTGKLPLRSGFAKGNLYSDGSVRPYDDRVTFLDYMKYEQSVDLVVEDGYVVILCTYNENLSMINRTVYSRPVGTITIPANTIFRLTIYNPDVYTISNPLELASKIYIPISNQNNDPADVISIFESFAVIGDSLACGYVGSGTGDSYGSNVARAAHRNWPSYLSLRLDRPFTNLARGSSTAKDWRYGNQTLDVDISTADIDTYCYMVGIGVNDARQSLTVGNPSDIKSDKSNNENTFYGNYDYLIRQLREYKANRISQAKIFVFTIPPTESNAETYNTAIRYIASLYQDVHCIDLFNLYYKEFTSVPLTGLWIGGHSRPLGYAYVGDLIRKAIDNYMILNYSSFSYDPWVPL